MFNASEYIRHTLQRCEIHLIDTQAAPSLLQTVRGALSVLDKPYATADELASVLGTRNWVIHRRTPRIEAIYGKDVLALSPKRYANAERRAIEARIASL